jgi:hypothetical protein
VSQPTSISKNVRERVGFVVRKGEVRVQGGGVSGDHHKDERSIKFRLGEYEGMRSPASRGFTVGLFQFSVSMLFSYRMCRL